MPEQSKEFKVTGRRHDIYTKMKPVWQFYINSYKGGFGFIEGNLFQHQLEKPEVFAGRKKRAYYLNYCKPLPNIYTDYLYREQAKRPENWNPDVMANIDGRGKSVSEFMPIISTLASVYGQVHVLVDKPFLAAPALSKAQAPLPYCVIYKPENVLDWSIDQNGKLNWVLLSEPTFSDLNPKAARVALDRYRLLTLDGWELYEVKEDKEYVVGSGVWKFGKIPFVTCYHSDSDEDLMGESMLSDIAPINRTIMNWCSCIDEQIERQTFSQLVMPEGDDAGSQGASPKELSTASIFTFPANSKFMPSFISPDTTQISIIWQMVERHVGEIYRLALLDKGNDALLAAQSGVAKAYDFIDTNQAIATKAMMMQRFENDILETIGLWTGGEPTEQVQYPKEFDIVNLANDIKNTFDLVSQQISDTFNKLMYKRVVRKALKGIDPEDLVTIDKEIDESSTIATTDINIDETSGEPDHITEMMDGAADDTSSTNVPENGQ